MILVQAPEADQNQNIQNVTPRSLRCSHCFFVSIELWLSKTSFQTANETAEFLNRVAQIGLQEID